MIKSSTILQRVCLAGAVLVLVSACSSTALRAPVESRTATSVSQQPAAASAPTTQASVLPRPGYHVVKKGETLYSIALEYGQDYHDVATWSGLDNPNVIEVGQELRVAPPESQVVTTTPVVVTPSIEVTPVAPAQSAPAVTPGIASSSLPANANGVKTEPKGGRIPYSPQAWTDLQNSAKPAEAASTPAVTPAGNMSAPVAKPPVPPAASSPVIPPAPAASEAKNGDDGMDWLWPASGKVIATFNDSTSKGIDLAGSLGDPVLATAPGKVIYVGSDLRGYGNLVIIKHNNLFLSAYAHNKEVLVKEGQAVQRGQKIATLGASDADRPKLHFEIRRQGKPVDPLKYLPKR